MFCTLVMFIQSATSSGNSLSAMSIAFGTLMNCISCSWVQLTMYCTGCSNTWKLEMSKINLTIDSHQYHDIQASSASLNHSIGWKVAPGRAKRPGAWSEHCQWIAVQYLTAPRMTGKLRRKQSLMKCYREQCRNYVNSLYLTANKITLTYPSQHETMHWMNFTRRRVPFENRKCRSLGRPKWMNSWQWNPISYENKSFIQSMLQWKFRCMGPTRLQHQNGGNFRCAWIEPDKRQLNGQMLISRGQSSNYSAKSIRWHLSNTSFSINYSNIMSNNYYNESGLRQPVAEAYSPKSLLK